MLRLIFKLFEVLLTIRLTIPLVFWGLVIVYMIWEFLVQEVTGKTVYPFHGMAHALFFGNR